LARQYWRAFFFEKINEPIVGGSGPFISVPSPSLL